VLAVAGGYFQGAAEEKSASRRGGCRRVSNRNWLRGKARKDRSFGNGEEEGWLGGREEQSEDAYNTEEEEKKHPHRKKSEPHRAKRNRYLTKTPLHQQKRRWGRGTAKNKREKFLS